MLWRSDDLRLSNSSSSSSSSGIISNAGFEQIILSPLGLYFSFSNEIFGVNERWGSTSTRPFFAGSEIYNIRNYNDL